MENNNINLWELSETWPIRMYKKFKDINDYDYSFYLYSYHYRDESFEKPSHNIWVHVLSDKSFEWIDEDNPKDKLVIADVNTCDKFYREDMCNFLELSVSFNPLFFVLGGTYVCPTTSTYELMELIEFQSELLKFKSLTTLEIHEYKITDLLRLELLDTYVYNARDRVKYPWHTALDDCLNTIQKVVPLEITTVKTLPNKNLAHSQKVYTYNNKLCYIKDINLVWDRVEIGFINNAEDTYIDMDKLDKLSPLLSYSSKKGITQKLSKIQTKPTTIFRGSGAQTFILYKDKKGNLKQYNSLNGIHMCWEIKTGEDTITPTMLHSCHTNEWVSVSRDIEVPIIQFIDKQLYALKEEKCNE